MSAALSYLQRKEWSMGNGQCPDCYGVSPKWLGHPLYMTADSIGHKQGCPLATVIASLSATPVMIGSFVPTAEQLEAAAPRLERSRAMQEAFVHWYDKMFFSAMMGAGR